MKSQFWFVCLYYTIMIPSWKIKIVRKIHIQPNLLRNWKKEFLANASLAFDNKREDNLREKLAEERKEKAEYAKKVGQLTMQVVWLKKNLKKYGFLYLTAIIDWYSRYIVGWDVDDTLDRWSQSSRII